MLSLEQLRKNHPELGDLSDEEFQSIVEKLTLMAKLLFELWKENRQHEKLKEVYAQDIGTHN